MALRGGWLGGEFFLVFWFFGGLGLGLWGGSGRLRGWWGKGGWGRGKGREGKGIGGFGERESRMARGGGLAGQGYRLIQKPTTSDSPPKKQPSKQSHAGSTTGT